jgi:hypothetical protein
VLLHAGDWIDRVGAVVAELHRSVHPDCEEVFDAATQGLHVHDERHGLVMARH